MTKQQIQANTTLYPVPVVLVTCGKGKITKILTLNRIACCNAEPPMISIPVRPTRASHDLIDQIGEFVVNIPWPEMEIVSDFVGVTTSRKTDKWRETGFKQEPAAIVKPPLLAVCPVNLECQVRHTLRLPSHSLFIAGVVAIHADERVLDERQEVDMGQAVGLVYRSSVVRERPMDNFKPAELLDQVRKWRDNR